MIIIKTCCKNIFLISNHSRNSFFRSFKLSYFLTVRIPCKHRRFCSHLTGVNNFSVLFMLIKTDNVVIMGVKECLITIMSVHKNSQTCCVIGNDALINISKIISAIFCSVSVSKLEFEFYRRCFSSTFIRDLGWLFYCSFPWFYSHKLIPFIFLLIKVIHCFRDCFFILFYFRNSDLF